MTRRCAPLGARAFAPWLASIVIAGLAGCQSVPPAADAVDASASAFEAAGRLSAKQGDAALAANFHWRHDAASDSIALGTPLGQTLATLERSSEGARVTLGDGRHAEAASVEALIREAFGVEVPVEGLTAWMRARPVAGSAYDVERDDRGRTVVLRQEGWQIAYAYADAASRLPSRLTLDYPDIDIRIVVDRWQ